MDKAKLIEFYERRADDLFVTPDGREARSGAWIAEGLRRGLVSPKVGNELRESWQSAGPGARRLKERSR